MLIAPRPTLGQRAHASELLASGPLTFTSHQSSALWILLRGLEKNAEIAELVAAGVPQRQIEMLCPLEFAHIIPGIVDFITPEKYASIKDSKKWNEYAVRPKNVARSNPDVRKALDTETSRFMSTSGYGKLRDHIQACLPADASLHHAKAMALALWYCWWGMLHLEGTSLPYRLRVEEALVKTVNWVLPGLS